jgi:putative DNA methylase
MARQREDLTDYVGKELTVIAWLWARTVPSPDPACAAVPVPLVKSFWLATKRGNRAWLEPEVDRKKGTYRFHVHVGTPAAGVDPRKGTVTRTGAVCLLSGAPMTLDYVRNAGKSHKLGVRLMAIVAEGTRGRVYLSPAPEHETAALLAMPSDVPDTPLPQQALGFRVQLYGMRHHSELFTNRQLLALTTFSNLWPVPKILQHWH